MARTCDSYFTNTKTFFFQVAGPKRLLATLKNQSSVRYYAAPTTKLFINGEFVESKATEFIDVCNPATNEVVTRVPKATQREMEDAVESAKDAFKSWSKTSILSRQQIMFKFQNLIKGNMVSLLPKCCFLYRLCKYD